MARSDVAFNALFAAEWLFGQGRVGRSMSRSRENLIHGMLETASRAGHGGVYPVERRRGLSPEAFREQYFLPGTPVVLEGAAAEWAPLASATPKRCGLMFAWDICRPAPPIGSTDPVREGPFAVDAQA